MKKVITLLLFFSISFPVLAEVIQGKVIHIADGDTLTIFTKNNQQIKVRLSGIDAPEKAQPFGKKSKQFLARLAFQKQATVNVETKDRYRRSIGKVVIEGVDINSELIRQGMAWVYRKYTNDKKLYKLEAEAKQASRGLWGFDKPIEPWLWRKGKRDVEHTLSNGNGVIIGNKSSYIYHFPRCPSYELVSKRNRVLFMDEKMAIENGYRKAGNCD